MRADGDISAPVIALPMMMAVTVATAQQFDLQTARPQGSKGGSDTELPQQAARYRPMDRSERAGNPPARDAS